MPSKLIYNESNWLFEDPQKNAIHDITIDDINQLLNYAEQDSAEGLVLSGSEPRSNLFDNILR